ncbi:pancreatic lipase-related protein 2 [Trichonephila inaurata madagascariensis]|uniref:Pancreatic lipase-related protein 2 n=1 Tax=Trichonephila inaurata madagascariensis TaxID=2747483 RepID=A0A8X6Y3P1_9ARAC|nr:pancreatic lipase-related protein 2 [Trichonephila inaurata madagascariensis]
MFLPLHGKDPEPIFVSYSYRSPNLPEYVTNANFSDWDINRSGFDAKVQTVFVMHGFRETGVAWPERLKDALLNRYKCNVIIVVWGQIESSFEEEKEHLPAIGDDIAFFIENLVVSKNIDLQDVYLIGKSLGAHIAGFTGKAVKKKLNSLVGRITGLDPGGPDYYNADATERLDVTDASFVDVIHTNAACTRLEGLGYPYSCGHFDFYVNGGSAQPGCREANEYLFEMTSSEFRSSLNYLFGSVDSGMMTSSTNQEMADIRFIYDVAVGNALEGQRLYGERFPSRRSTKRKTFERLHRRLRETGSFVSGMHDTGRTRSAWTRELEELVLLEFERQPERARGLYPQPHDGLVNVGRPFEDLDKSFLCSHVRALDIFLASIENEACEFTALECSSWSRYLSGECDNHDVAVMGYRADMYKELMKNSSRMKFYLKTGGIYPYCL